MEDLADTPCVNPWCEAIMAHTYGCDHKPKATNDYCCEACQGFWYGKHLAGNAPCKPEGDHS